MPCWRALPLLRDSGRYVSIDYLGEDVTDADDADAAVRAYLELLDALGRFPRGATGVRPLEVSLKLSALGQALGRDGEKIALENARIHLRPRAERVGAWVTVDAEDHTTTDSTLSICAICVSEFAWLGTVLQAYLRRTLDDCRSSPRPARESGCARAPMTNRRRWPTVTAMRSPTLTCGACRC